MTGRRTSTTEDTASKVGRSYRDRTLKLIWGLSAARCNKCRVEVVAASTPQDRAAVLGKIAHIAGHSNAGPRANSAISASQRDEYSNLLLLCGTCHDLVDGQPNTYSCEVLRQMKLDHEAWVRECLAKAMPLVGFAELEILAKALMNAPGMPVTTYTVTDPSMKMERNGLTNQIRHLLTMGMAKAREVENFVSQAASMDDEYPERLKAGFVAKYTVYRSQGIEGDGLFEALVQFAAGGTGDIKRTATGLAVLAYLFEKCEVFEP